MSGAKWEKKFCSAIHFVSLITYKYNHSFWERFRDNQYIWSVSRLLFLYSWCPRAQPVVM